MDGKPISLKAIDDKNVRGMNRVLVVFSDGLLSELDSTRGLVSRSAWIRQAVEDKLMKEAVAPLVPDSWVPNGSESPSTEAFGYGFREVKAEPKPKARQKGIVTWNGDFSEDGMFMIQTAHVRGEPVCYTLEGRTPEAKELIHRARVEGAFFGKDGKGKAKQAAVEVLATMIPKKIEGPQHCNRGACTGTIKPNGRCIRCNQEPLKESK